jgi:hypothetical protein
MKILDCETSISTYKSLAVITGVSSKKIEDFLTNLCVKNIYAESRSDFILKKFKSRYNVSLEYDLICWFHLTRNSELNEYKDGLLPLNEVIDKIWDFLFTLTNGIVTIAEWNRYRNDLENGKLGRDIISNQAFHYNNKINTSSHWGPYGFLIEDQILKDSSISVYYFKRPEIVMHICYPFKNLYNYDLLKAYENKTVPLIIKFQSRNTEIRYIGDAFHYLYNLIHDIEMHFHSNNTFDNKGKKVPAEDIISIKFVN